jgi:signal transduction histidine kinase
VTYPRWTLSALHEISELFSTSSELSDLVQKIASSGAAIAKGDACWLALRVDPDSTLDHAASCSLSDESVQTLSLDIESWLPEMGGGTDNPLVLTDLKRDDPLGRVAAVEGCATAVLVPITYNDNLTGVLVVFWKQAEAPGDDQTELLMLVAHLASGAIANARLLSQARHRASALDAIFNVTQMIGASPKMQQALNVILDEANSLFGTDQSQIRLINPSTRELEIRAHRGFSKTTMKRMLTRTGRPSLSAWVAKQGKPKIINDVNVDPLTMHYLQDADKVASMMSVPMMVEAKTIGVLTIGSPTPKLFTHEDESLLMTLASQAAIVIENARLYDQLKKRLAEQKVLYGIAQHLSSTLDVPTLLKFVINHLSAFFRANFGTIRLLDEAGTTLMTGAIYGISDEYIRHANENMQIPMDPSVPQGQSPAAVALNEQRIVAISNIAKDRRFNEWRKVAKMQSYTSVICVPLVPSDNPIGVISLYFQTIRRLQPEEYELLQTSARASAIALQRAMLDERLLKEEVSRRALEEISHLKTEFVSLVSHELRTPLTSIQGYVRLILAGHTGGLDPVQQEFLGAVSRNTDRLVALVDDLLDISRIESGRLELVLEPLRISEIIENELEALRTQFETKNISTSTDVQEGLPRVKADLHRLGQIISNLLSNAIKYSPENTAVKITASQIGKNVLVKVIDSGIGIAPEERNRLFERFYRGDNDFVRATWGTGLGLAITHHLVEMHGGKIWIESEKGHGSTFSFSIPAILND